MQSISHEKKGRTGMNTFSRNHYYKGKMLDVYHFELEQNYFNNKRWLLNRLVSGYGVVCGLDVEAVQDGRAVVVTPGVALDQGGREIIVPHTSDPVPIPPRPKTPNHQHTVGKCDTEDYVHLCICFHQCESDPTPVFADDCSQATTCSASSIQEGYKLVIRDCKAPDIDLVCEVSDFVRNNHINYRALVDRVTKRCPELPADLCIPLANIRLTRDDEAAKADETAKASDTDKCIMEIDISPRPIVYSNDLLFDLVLALAGESAGRSRGGKK